VARTIFGYAAPNLAALTSPAAPHGPSVIVDDPAVASLATHMDPATVPTGPPRMDPEPLAAASASEPASAAPAEPPPRRRRGPPAGVILAVGVFAILLSAAVAFFLFRR
jgi:hypothetical protein